LLRLSNRSISIPATTEESALMKFQLK
jgi:hypothetical protein